MLNHVWNTYCECEPEGCTTIHSGTSGPCESTGGTPGTYYNMYSDVGPYRITIGDQGPWTVPGGQVIWRPTLDRVDLWSYETFTGAVPCTHDVVSGDQTLITQVSGTQAATIERCDQAQDSPDPPAEPTRPSGVPDAPASTCAETDLCTQLEYVLADLQHLFAQLSTFRTDALADTALLISDTTQLLGDVAAVKADTEGIIATQLEHTGTLQEILQLLEQLTEQGLVAGAGVAVSGSDEVILPADCAAVAIAASVIPTYMGQVFATPARRELGDVAFGRLSSYGPTQPIEFAASLYWPLTPGTDRVSYRLAPGVTGTLTPYTRAVA